MLTCHRSRQQLRETAVAFFKQNENVERRATWIQGDSWEQGRTSHLRSGNTFWGKTNTGVDLANAVAGQSENQLEAQIWAPQGLEEVASFGVGTRVNSETLDRMKKYRIPIYEMGCVDHPEVGFGCVRIKMIFDGTSDTP